MTEEFDTATATGRLMLTMLSGFAAHERELIRERSVAGTNRLAEAGAWRPIHNPVRSVRVPRPSLTGLHSTLKFAVTNHWHLVSK